MKGPITTLMLRNLPQKYTPDVLLKEVKEVLGSTVSFDFLHLPWDTPGRCNVGFAFINCCDVEGAQACRKMFDDYLFRRGTRNKQCKVFVAHIQGLEKNLIHLMGTAVAESSTHDPVIFWQGHRLRLKQVVAALHELPDQPDDPQEELAGDVVAPGSGPPWPAAMARHPRAPASTGLPARPAQPALPPKPASAGDPASRLSSRGKAGSTQSTSLGESQAEPSSSSGGGPAPDAWHGGPDDKFNRVLAEVSLARRVRDIMRAKGILVPGTPSSEGMAGAASPPFFVSEGQDSGVRPVRSQVQRASRADAADAADWPAVSQQWPRSGAEFPAAGHGGGEEAPSWQWQHPPVHESLAAGHGAREEAPSWQWQSPLSHAAPCAQRPAPPRVPAGEWGPQALSGTRVLESDRDLGADAYRKFFQKFGSGEAVQPAARGPEAAGGGGGVPASASGVSASASGAQEASLASYHVMSL